jgi:trimeric autotransporter adhesin
MSSIPIFNPRNANFPNRVEGNFEVTGNTQLDGNLNVLGSEVVHGNLTVFGTISGGGGGGTNVTTTTLNNGTLPASLTTLAVSGNETVGGNEIVTGSVTALGGVVSQSNTGLPAYTFVNGLNVNPGSGGSGIWKNASNEVAMYAPSGVVTTSATGTVQNILDDGTGDMSAVGHISSTSATHAAAYEFNNAIAVIPSAGNGVWLNATNQVSLYGSGGVVTTNSGGTARNVLDDSAGNMVVTGTISATNIPSGTIVTTTTLSNNTLPGSFTTLNTSGSSTLHGPVQINGNTNSVTTSDFIVNNTGTGGGILGSFIEPSLSTPGAIYLAIGTAFSANNMAFIQYLTGGQTVNGVTLTAPAVGLTIYGNAPGLLVTSGSVPHTYTLNNTLDNNGNANFVGTVEIGNSTITGSGSGTSIAMPSSSGTLAIVPSSVYGSVNSGNTFTSILAQGTSGRITVSGGNISINTAGTYLARASVTCNVTTLTLGSLDWSNSGGTTTVNPGFSYNGAATTQTLTLITDILIVVSSTASLSLTPSSGTTISSGIFQIIQIA